MIAGDLSNCFGAVAAGQSSIANWVSHSARLSWCPTEVAGVSELVSVGAATNYAVTR